MKKRTIIGTLASLAAALCLFCGCGIQGIPGLSEFFPEASNAPASDSAQDFGVAPDSPEPEVSEAPDPDMLTVGVEALSGTFSPFFCESDGDRMVSDLTVLRLGTTDRSGNIITTGISGQSRVYGGTEYLYYAPADFTVTEQGDGTATYDIALREGLLFSDGTAADIDDVIFSLYVCADPAYDGPLSLRDTPILGIGDYPASADSIAGIERLDDYTLRITTTEADSAFLSRLIQIPIAPMAYYGNESKYDYAGHSFGFDPEDLGTVLAKSAQPMGAGPYVLHTFSDGTARLESNPYYYKGQPRITALTLMAVDGDIPALISDGTIDLALCRDSVTLTDTLASGVSVLPVPTGSYGYIGIHGELVSVDGDPGSDASRYLRQALAIVLCEARDEAVSSFFGNAAAVIDAPISDISWAAPEAASTPAYALLPDGSPIYTEGMDSEARRAEARKAALTCFEAAGYTVEDDMLTAAPSGASLSYTVCLDGAGTGDHPAYGLLEAAAAEFSSIGFTLSIADTPEAEAKIRAGEAALFCAAWELGAEPELFSRYHSLGLSNVYGISDPALDALLASAHTTLDVDTRRALYGSAMDVVLDWAVEVPLYRRSSLLLYASNRLDSAAFPQDLTVWWNWTDAIEALSLLQTP